MAFQCLSLGDGLFQNPFGDLEVKLAPDSGLEVVGGQGLSILAEQRAAQRKTYSPDIYVGGTKWTKGNGTANGWYVQIGPIVYTYVDIQLGSTSSLGSTGGICVTAPTAIDRTLVNPGSNLWGHINLADASASVAASTVPVIVVTGPTNGFGLVYYTWGTTTVNYLPTTDASPFVWSANDRIHGYFIYFAG